MNGLNVLHHFETYQKARVAFVQSVAEAASKPQTIDVMYRAGVVNLLRPLLLDTVPSVQQSAALALGRLANFSEEIAESIVTNEVLPQLVYSLSDQNRYFKKSAAYVLRSVAKHSPELAKCVCDSGALESLIRCLEEFDPAVKENAAWAIGYIAQHTEELAQVVVDSGAVSLLILCLQEPEVPVKRISASALSDISKHTAELAHTISDAGAVPHLSRLLSHPDSKLKRQVCSALGQISKHKTDLAECVVEAEIFPTIMCCLKDSDPIVRKNTATCLREIARHTPDLAQLVAESGGAAAMVDYVASSKGSNCLPGIMALGYIGAFTETLASAVIAAGAVETLKESLSNEKEDHIRAACVWSLGQIGKHTTEHAMALAEASVLPKILESMTRADSSDDLQEKSRRALKTVIEKCTHCPALQSMLRGSPIKIQEYILQQLAQLLPKDVEARRQFAQSGCLQYIQELSEAGAELCEEFILAINACYPPEVVEYYSPNYGKAMLEKIDSYKKPAVKSSV